MNKLDEVYIMAAASIGQQIRSNHVYSYKSGEWGTIIGAEKLFDRVIWEILWPDGCRDQWVVEDPDADYEVSDVNYISRIADDAVLALTKVSMAIVEDMNTPGIRAPRELRKRLISILQSWEKKPEEFTKEEVND